MQEGKVEELGTWDEVGKRDLRKKSISRVEGVQVDELGRGCVTGARPAGGGARPGRHREEGARTAGSGRGRWGRRSSVGPPSLEHVEITAALERGSRERDGAGPRRDSARAGRQREKKATLDRGVWRAAWPGASSRRPAARPPTTHWRLG